MYHHAISLIQQGRPQEAIREIVALMPLHNQDPALHVNLALAFEEVGDVDRAEKGYQFAVNRWNSLDAIINYAGLLGRQFRFWEAEVLLTSVRHPHAKAALVQILIDQLHIDDAVALAKEVGAASKNAKAESVALGLSLHTGYDAAAHKAWADKYAAKQAPPSRWDGKRKIRIGYTGVRPGTSVFACLAPVIAGHSNEVEVYVYAEPGSKTDDQLIRQIQADGIDVLIDTEGHKLGSRIMVHAARPAPLQYTYVGYAGDTFLGRNIDQEVGWTYRPPAVLPERVLDKRAQGRPFTVGSANREAKVTARTMRAWGFSIESKSDIHIKVMVKGGEKNTEARRQLERYGVPGERLELVPRRPKEIDYLAFANEIDIHLDTVPYGGGAVACDMLAMGVPTVGLAEGPYAMGGKIMAGLPSGPEVAAKLEALIRRELKVAEACCG